MLVEIGVIVKLEEAKASLGGKKSQI